MTRRCETCFHKNVCHAVAECINVFDNFRCNDYVEEPKQGEWVDENKGTVFYKSTCSLCGWICHGVSLNFCPNCGADMRRRVGEAE